MEKKVEFTGIDNGLSAMISKLKVESQQLGSDMLADARKYSDSQREQVQYIEDQIKAITRRTQLEKESQLLTARGQMESAEQKYGSGSMEAGKAKVDYGNAVSNANKSVELESMQVSLLRELVETTKLRGKEEIVEDREKVKDQIKVYEQQLRDGKSVDPIEAFKREQQKGILAEGAAGKAGVSMLTSLMANSLMGQAGGIVRGMPSATSELDMITGATTLMGTGVGGLAGAALDLANAKVLGTGLGKAGFTALGANIGGQIGAFGGESLSRSFRSRAELSSQMKLIQGLVGSGGFVDFENGGSLESIGMDRIAQAKLSEQIARSSGTGAGLAGNTRSAAMISKAFSLSDSDIMGQFSAGRVSGGGAMEGVTKMFDKLITQGIIKEEDRVLFGEIIGNQAQLTQMFGKSMAQVNVGGVQDLITGFDTWGGSFAATDPRSLNNIMSLNQQLSNPKNDYMKAMGYQTLKGIDPGAGIFDIKMMQQRGLMTEGFLGGMIGQLGSTGMSEQNQLYMLSEMFTGYDEEAYRAMLKNPNMTTEEIGNLKKSKSLQGMAGSATTKIQQSKAEITNMFIAGFVPGIKTVSDKFTEAMGMSITEVAAEMKKEFNRAVKESLDKKKSVATDKQKEQASRTVKALDGMNL
jgi:hypothetical protein